MNRKRMFLWDLPTRLFHWLLALAVVAAVLSGQLGGNLIDWHGRIGLFVVGLVAFRLVWGFVGSTYARFAQFFPTPGQIKAYLADRWRGEGHNPLGALAVFALLAVLALQVASGLCANDDIAFVGPLYDLVGREWSDRLTGLHHLLANILIGLAVLHVVAIMFYAHARKQNLVKPMITGWKDNGEGEPARGGGWPAFAVAVVFALATVYGASGLWLPEPPPPPVAAETPSW